MAIDIRDQDFDQQVLKSSLPVVVDFWAAWCGPCVMIGTMVQKLSDEYRDKLKFCKINVDENHDTASKYDVMSLPTLLFFKKGQLVGQTTGKVSEHTLRSKLDELL
jgi:thioredoxin 1